MVGSKSLRRLAVLFLAVLLASGVAGTVAQAQGVRIENRWKPEMAVESRNSPVRVAPVGPEYVESQWVFVKQGNNAYFIVHKATNLALTAAQRPTLKPFDNADINQVWLLDNLGEFYRIRPGSNAMTGQALHIERGVLEVGAVEPGWWSAHWKLPNFNPNVATPMPQTALAAPAAAARQQGATRYYRVVNRYHQQLSLDWERPEVGATAQASDDKTSLWAFSPITVQTANGPREAFLIRPFEGRQVMNGEASAVMRPFQSFDNPDPRSLWFVEQNGKHVRIRNAAAPERYLHTEGGTLGYGTISPGWWSADWSLEAYDVQAMSRIINTREAADAPPPPAAASTTAGQTQRAPRYFRVVNRYNQQHVLDWVNAAAGTSAQGPTDLKSLWIFSPTTVQTATGPKEAFIIQTFTGYRVINGEALPMLRPFTSRDNPDPKSLWFVEQSGKFARIRNVVAPDRYLNIESGQLQFGQIQPGWWSADWILEPYDPVEAGRMINARSSAVNPPSPTPVVQTAFSQCVKNVPGTFMVGKVTWYDPADLRLLPAAAADDPGTTEDERMPRLSLAGARPVQADTVAVGQQSCVAGVRPAISPRLVTVSAIGGSATNRFIDMATGFSGSFIRSFICPAGNADECQRQLAAHTRLVRGKERVESIGLTDLPEGAFYAGAPAMVHVSGSPGNPVAKEVTALD